MKRLFPSTLFGQLPIRRDPAQVKTRGSSRVKADAESAAWCSMKLAEAERRARDGRESACCG
jgi:hypothetical protein